MQSKGIALMIVLPALAALPRPAGAQQADALAALGDRRAALANDLTKMYEQVTRGQLSELIAQLEGTRLRGEYVVVIAGAEDK